MFGESHYDKHNIEYDRQFIRNAKEALKQGYYLYYTSSW